MVLGLYLYYIYIYIYIYFFFTRISILFMCVGKKINNIYIYFFPHDVFLKL